MKLKKILQLGVLSSSMMLMTNAAHADINIGVILSLTGPGSGLGIPVKNGFALWPDKIAGEKINLIFMDDATDPTTANKAARRLVVEDKVDLLIGSASVPATLSIADVAFNDKVVQLAVAPVELPKAKDAWTFRLPQSTTVMAAGIVNHMKQHGVKSFSFLGYSDSYGENWLRETQLLAQQAGIKMTVAERFARADTSVTAQALRTVSSAPDAILVVASGSGAAMPHKTLVERGYKGKIYQTHSAASRDLIRLGGRDVEGAFVVSGPAVVPEQLPASAAFRDLATDFVTRYEKLYGPGTRNLFAAHAYDGNLVLQKVLPMALKKAKPGTQEFRDALRVALETAGPILISQGTIHYTDKDHFGLGDDARIVLTIKDGKWEAAK